MTFVDTNYFLRFLLRDVDDQHEKAGALFRDGAEGKVDLVTSVIVFFEIYWVLESFYERKRSELIPTLRNILDLRFVKLEEQELLKEALDIFEQTALELEDCFNLSYAKRLEVTEFKTFDTKLARKFKDQELSS